MQDHEEWKTAVFYDGGRRKDVAFLEGIGNKVHFIGIGGIGMSGLARILLGFGVTVVGSDAVESAVLEQLKGLGATIYLGHRYAQIAEDTSLVVYSSAVKEDNPEVIAAKELGIPIVGRAVLLSRIMALCESIGVAGAHGKTTTTGMIGTMLLEAAQDPTIVVGGILPAIGSNARWGEGKYLVAEADESDGSFLCLLPKIAVVTNVEDDHLDYYVTVERLEAAFRQYISQVPSNGFAILNIDSAPVAAMAQEGLARTVTYGLKNLAADYTAKNIRFENSKTLAEIYQQGILLGTLTLQVPGEYNVSNALAAIALGRELGLDFSVIARGLYAFRGTGRRFEVLGQGGGITVVDDYAHHPTEIKAVLAAAKNLPYQRVVAVFQPHRYSRTMLFVDEFGNSFANADVVLVNEIYSAFEKPIEGVSAQLIVDSVRKHGKEKVYYGEKEADILQLLETIARPGDLIMILGAGNIRHAGEVFAATVEKLR